MAENDSMEIDGLEPAAHAVPESSTIALEISHDSATEQPTEQQQPPVPHRQSDIISQLEVDSDRSDNDSALGSDITSYVARCTS
jgi:hypothetical protein